jgi:glycosyltransferase involved in cell wall biosynthesis
LDNSETLRAAFVGNGLPKETRVVILFHRFGPYHHARLNAAGRLMSVWGVESCTMEDTYDWAKVEGATAFTRVTLTDRDSGERQWKQEFQFKLWHALDEIKPQMVVVPGWSSADALSALCWCGETNTPSVVMSESTAWDERRVVWKEWIKGRLVNLNSAGLAGGTPQGDYLSRLGLALERIFLGYDVVDNDYFAAKAAEIRNQKLEIRNQHGLPEKYFLASARFVEKKNLPRLIEAYARYRKLAEKTGERAGTTEVWDLVLLGDGPLRSGLCNLISTLRLGDCVHLPGFKQYNELPVYFGLAGAFVHASTTEQWGLVVNEAMASGLPVLASSRCGCAADLVQEGVNGFTFDPWNVEQLAQLMSKISAASFPLSDFGAASRRIISVWGPEQFANGLRDAVTMALKNPRPRAGLLDQWLLRFALANALKS